jgi:hypothetical protein
MGHSSFDVRHAPELRLQFRIPLCGRTPSAGSGLAMSVATVDADSRRVRRLIGTGMDRIACRAQHDGGEKLSADQQRKRERSENLVNAALP